MMEAGGEDDGDDEERETLRAVGLDDTNLADLPAPDDPPPPAAPPSAPFVPPSLGQLMAALPAWKTAALDGIRILSARARALRTPLLPGAPGLPNPKHLSLVEDLAGTARFVHWVDWSKKLGKYVRLDDLNRVIYNMDRAVPLEYVIIVHTDLGVAMYKEKGSARASMPEWALRMHHIWNAALEFGAPTPYAECALCCGSSETRLMMTCPLCLNTSHRECCAALIAHGPSLCELGVPDSFPFPNRLKSRDLCRLCKRAVL